MRNKIIAWLFGAACFLVGGSIWAIGTMLSWFKKKNQHHPLLDDPNWVDNADEWELTQALFARQRSIDQFNEARAKDYPGKPSDEEIKVLVAALIKEAREVKE